MGSNICLSVKKMKIKSFHFDFLHVRRGLLSPPYLILILIYVYSELRTVFSLCPLSIFGAVRTGSYMTHILMTKGLQQSVCDQSFYNGPVSKFWAYAFVLSKAPELGKLKALTILNINLKYMLRSICIHIRCDLIV